MKTESDCRINDCNSDNVIKRNCDNRLFKPLIFNNRFFYYNYYISQVKSNTIQHNTSEQLGKEIFVGNG